MMTIEEQKKIITQLVEEMALRLNDYSERPMYYLQINKSACRLIVRVNDIPLGFFFIDVGGQSLLHPINSRLFSSGKHTFSIDVYPMSDSEFITKEAHVNVKLIRLADISLPLIQAETLMELNLPADIGTLELPFHTTSAEFYARVPFDHSHVLENLKDLRKVHSLEEKVVQRYNEIRQHILNFNAAKYMQERDWTFYGIDMHYHTKEEILHSRLRGFNNFFNPNVVGRKVHKIENYEMLIVGNGRFVLLRERDTLDHMLKVTFYEDEAHKLEEPESYWIWTRFILLGMPKGSDRLEMFY